jgi:dipeptidyl-peptidase-4
MYKVLLAALMASCALAQKRPVTIEAASSPVGGRAADQAGVPIWAPDGARFAYLEDKNLMLYDAASGARSELASLAPLEKLAVKPPPREQFEFVNRRVSTERIQWAGDGKSLLVVESGDLFHYAIGDKKWTQLTATSEPEQDPRLSPDGKRVAFLRGSDMYSLEIASKRVTRLTRDGSATLWNGRPDWVYPEELALGRAFWWAPDSAKIAYLQFDIGRELIHPQMDLLPARAVYESQRYPKAGTNNADVRVGVVAAEGGETRWLDIGETRDRLLARLAWLPDSERLAVQRLNRVQNHLQLLLIHAASGTSRTLLDETDPWWINVDDSLRFLPKSNRFLWASERSGYRHLYLYSMEGKLQKQLTGGEWEVTKLAGLSESTRRVYFVSTEAGPLDRHLYSVSFDGGARHKLTTAEGTHSIGMSPTAAYYQDSHSSAVQPPRRTIHDASGKQLSVFREADSKLQEMYELLPAEIVKVPAEDGTTLYARLIKPAKFDPVKKYPAIVMVYGGPHTQTVTNAWSGASFNQALAHRGFVIWQLDNRGSSGRGHRFETKLYRRLGMQELEDQIKGVEYLVAQGFVDPARVGIHGWSYGGFMTLYSMLNAPCLFKAGIAGAPVIDWRNYDTIYTERYLGLPQQNNDGYKKSSPVEFAENLEGKLMIVHNFEDDNVLFQNTMQMNDALQRAGKSFELMLFPQKAHGVTGPSRRYMLERMAAFFETNLAR